MIEQTKPTAVVWDSPAAVPAGPERVILWRSFGARDGTQRSIPRYLEEHAETLRGSFLAWVHQLGETRFRDKRLLDHLVVRPGFSFWWTTLLSEKSTFSSPHILNVLKVMALEQLVGRDLPGRLVLVSDDERLAQVLQRWCRNVDVPFEWRATRTTDASRRSWLESLYRASPHVLRACWTLARYIIQRWPLRAAGLRQLRASRAQTTFCSYLFNLNADALRAGRFRSSFWTQLHAAFESEARSVNWLLMFMPHELVPSARRARRLVDDFNRGARQEQVHGLVDAVLGAAALLATVRDYLVVARAAWRLRSLREHFRPTGSALDLWPMLAEDWRASLYGPTAVINCLYLNLFERLLRALPPQQLGVYLQENIGWEMSFVHCWRAAGHGRLVGVPHSTVRFWDLRYFFDARSYGRGGDNALPLPDVVAVNGPAAANSYLAAGFPRERLVEVEALRYLHLNEIDRAPRSAQRAPGDALRVLVLGDYVPASTHRQMQWLVAAAANLPGDTRYIVKPHPACPVDAAGLAGLDARIVNESLATLLPDCDVAYTSNMTSGAVDAYEAGVPVVCVLDPEAFNASPLRGLDGVKYVSDFEELAQALRSADRTAGRTRSAGYFCLDPQLPRWRKLLGLRQSA